MADFWRSRPTRSPTLARHVPNVRTIRDRPFILDRTQGRVNPGRCGAAPATRVASDRCRYPGECLTRQRPSDDRCQTLPVSGGPLFGSGMTKGPGVDQLLPVQRPRARLWPCTGVERKDLPPRVPPSLIRRLVNPGEAGTCPSRPMGMTAASRSKDGEWEAERQ
jgi:hypothetical protein